MDSQPLISVILPTFNRADLLPRAINSVLDQTYQNWELIVWDDGSTDHTKEIVKSFLDKRILYIHDNNHGMSYALNNAIKKSVAGFIAFLDDDDEWIDYKLSLQMDILKYYPDIDMVFGNYHNVNLAKGQIGIGFEQNNIALRELKKEKIQERVFRITGNFHKSIAISNYVAFDSVLIRKKFLNRVGIFNEHLRNGMDFEFWWRFGLLDGKMAYTDEIVLKRVKPPNSLSSSSILASQNMLKTLDFCLEDTLTKRRKDLVPYLKIPYRNAWQNLIILYGQAGDRKGAWDAYLHSLEYGFRPGSARLLLAALIQSQKPNRFSTST